MNTSIKVKFRPSTVADREGSIYYQIIHDRKTRQLLSVCRVHPSEWDERYSSVTAGAHGHRREAVMTVREQIRRDVERLNKIVRRLDESGLIYSADDVIKEFYRFADEYAFFAYMDRVINNLKLNGQLRTSETYRATLNVFKRFRQGRDIMLDCITPEVMEAFEAWLRGRGVALNTVSFYARILRAVYNRAVGDDIIENRFPFRRVYTGVGKTVKRAISISSIKKIKDLDLASNPGLDYARDMFVMSFMLRGMSFVDMAFLQKTDMDCGHVTYRRRKTGQRLTIKWTKDMQEILDKYGENDSAYLLPIIRQPGLNERTAYRNAAYRINRNLKKIASMIDLPIPLTLYVSRHSWASAAQAKGIPVSVISEGMGHDSETTTRIYLASLDTSLVDRANAVILKSIK